MGGTRFTAPASLALTLLLCAVGAPAHFAQGAPVTAVMGFQGLDVSKPATATAYTTALSAALVAALGQPLITTASVAVSISLNPYNTPAPRSPPSFAYAQFSVTTNATYATVLSTRLGVAQFSLSLWSQILAKLAAAGLAAPLAMSYIQLGTALPGSPAAAFVYNAVSDVGQSSSSEITFQSTETTANAGTNAANYIFRPAAVTAPPYVNIATAKVTALKMAAGAVALSIPVASYGYNKFIDGSNICSDGTSSCKGLRCVDYQIGRDNASGTGDGFSRIDTSTASGKAALDIVRRVNTDNPSPVLTALSNMKGLNVWLLKQFAVMGNFSLVIDIVRLPSKDFYAVDRNKQLIKAFVDHNYDCVVTNTLMSHEKLPYMKFMMPTQPYGMQVVTTVPQVLERTFVSTIFIWTAVFSQDVWLVIAASLTVVGVAMWWLESKHNPENFGTTVNPRDKTVNGVGHGLYFAFAGFASKTEEFAPKTLSGRLLGIMQAFAIYLLCAFFTANLAVILLQGNPTKQTITSIADFQKSNLKACVLDKTTSIDFMTSFYPSTQTYLVPTYGSMLSSILAGTCAGGVAPDVHIKYLLGPDGDPAGIYCGLQTVGDLLNFGYFGIPFNVNLSSDFVNAMNVYFLQLLGDGSVTTEAALDFPADGDRTQCVVSTSIDPLAPALTLTQMSGIFLVSALGLITSFGIALLATLAAKLGLRPGRAVEQLHHFREHRGEEEGVDAAQELKELLETQTIQLAVFQERALELIMLQEERRSSPSATHKQVESSHDTGELPHTPVRAELFLSAAI